MGLCQCGCGATVTGRYSRGHNRRGIIPPPVVDASGCWIWQGATNETYGVVWDPERQRMIGAHRRAYEQNVGEIPDGHDVCHSCDTPLCVNPAHLWTGTRSENMLDMARKGRRKWDNRGERNPRARITREQAEEIRMLAALGERTNAQIGERYGLTESAVYKIVRGVAWAA